MKKRILAVLTAAVCLTACSSGGSSSVLSTRTAISPYHLSTARFAAVFKAV